MGLCGWSHSEEKRDLAGPVDPQLAVCCPLYLVLLTLPCPYLVTTGVTGWAACLGSAPLLPPTSAFLPFSISPSPVAQPVCVRYTARCTLIYMRRYFITPLIFYNELLLRRAKYALLHRLLWYLHSRLASTVFILHLLRIRISFFLPAGAGAAFGLGLLW